jgi:hypothetical protein
MRSRLRWAYPFLRVVAAPLVTVIADKRGIAETLAACAAAAFSGYCFLASLRAFEEPAQLPLAAAFICAAALIQASHVRALHAAGKRVNNVVTELGCSHASVYRAIEAAAQ